MWNYNIINNISASNIYFSSQADLTFSYREASLTWMIPR